MTGYSNGRRSIVSIINTVADQSRPGFVTHYALQGRRLIRNSEKNVIILSSS